MGKITIADLLEKNIAFMGSDWQPDKSVIDGPFPGQRCVGEKPCINCNDFFYWACADAEDISESTLPILEKAVEDCKGDLQWGALLYCSRQRKERPQGAYYSAIPKELWPLFDDCGPEREVDVGNPCKPGEKKLGELQPCTFCHALPELCEVRYDKVISYYYRCPNQGSKEHKEYCMTTSSHSTPEEATKEWNSLVKVVI